MRETYDICLALFIKTRINFINDHFSWFSLVCATAFVHNSLF